MSLIDRIHNLIHQSESCQPLSPYSQVPIPSESSPYQEIYKVYPEIYTANPGGENFYFSPPPGKKWEILYIVHRLNINNGGSYRRSYFVIAKKGTTGPPSGLDFRGYFGISSPQCPAGDAFGKGAYINYIPGGEYQAQYADWERGQVTPISNRTLDNNNKTITVPDYCLWRLSGITADIRTSATVAARTFNFHILPPVGDDVAIYNIPPVVLNATQIGYMAMIPGQTIYTTTYSPYNAVSIGPLGIRYLSAGYRIHIWDSVGVSANDDIRVEIDREEFYGLTIGTIPKESVAIPKLFLSAKDTPNNELIVAMVGVSGNDSHSCYIGVKESNER
jgi:hypothetical protein